MQVTSRESATKPNVKPRMSQGASSRPRSSPILHLHLPASLPASLPLYALCVLNNLTLTLLRLFTTATETKPAIPAFVLFFTTPPLSQWLHQGRTEKKGQIRNENRHHQPTTISHLAISYPSVLFSFFCLSFPLRSVHLGAIRPFSFCAVTHCKSCTRTADPSPTSRCHPLSLGFVL